MIPRKQQAIQTALMGNWEMAIVINEEILKENPTDIETLNRLAFAFTVVGKIKHARNAYQKVLALDIFNPIALKNLKRLEETGSYKFLPTIQIVNNIFLEESGKTKIVTLINTAPPKVIKRLQVGQQLNLCIKRLKIFVLNNTNEYIGMLPDNIGKRLIKFVKGGNVYYIYVKAIENHSVTIFIKEKKRAARFKNQSSFGCIEKSSLSFKKESPGGKNIHYPGRESERVSGGVDE